MAWETEMKWVSWGKVESWDEVRAFGGTPVTPKAALAEGSVAGTTLA